MRGERLSVLPGDRLAAVRGRRGGVLDVSVAAITSDSMISGDCAAVALVELVGAASAASSCIFSAGCAAGALVELVGAAFVTPCIISARCAAVALVELVGAASVGRIVLDVAGP